MRKRLIISKDIRPVLPRYVRLHRDAVRDRWVLLAPERIVEADEVAVDVLRLCDGRLTLGEIVAELAGNYHAAPDEIRADVFNLLQNLADSGYIKDNSCE
jgi:pyrroloquinoline quinone biosynthesis protein D